MADAVTTSLDSILEQTSRTFALTIPLLPDPTRRAVTAAYLLFRIADTFEDATAWSVGQRTEALADFSNLLDTPTPETAAHLARNWTRVAPVEHRGYVDLLAQTPLVLEQFGRLGAEAREILKTHVQRTARGMAAYVERTASGQLLELRDLPDLREYCYIVAGIVGEMLTELFLLEHASIAPAAEVLRPRARLFGEGLQLTNILKDSSIDHTEGRRYLPHGVTRSEIFDLARQDLEQAEEYVLALQRCEAPRGIIAFNALPVLLAWATLERVEERGPGAKLTRPEVFALVGHLDTALERHEPPVLRGAPRPD